ncbi:MAG: hypothetical protein ABIG64_02960 [Candidatus Omnitrophota bacterium]
MVSKNIKQCLHSRKILIFLVIFGVLFFYVRPLFSQETGFLKTKIKTVSGPKLNESERVKQVLRNLEIPEDMGFIKEIHVPSNPNDQLIITIQDLHCHYQAQKNICKVIDYLTTTYGLKVISVEGGSGKIDTTFYKELPDEKIKEQVADYFLKEARINGTEYFAITTNKDIALYGAEDDKYYNKNLDAFLKALPNRERILENISVLENDLSILKNKIYNKKLKALDDYIVAYENGEVDFENYITYICKLYDSDKLAREFPQVNQLYESLQIKTKVDLKKAEEQRKELIDYLSKNLTRYALEEFLKATFEFKAKNLDSLSYHNTLEKLYREMQNKSQVLAKAWPQLHCYIQYLNKHETLDKFELFHQLDKFVERIKNNIYTSYTQKTLDHNLKVIRLARNLFSTKLLNRDMQAITKYRSEFKAKDMKKFIKSQMQRLKLELHIPSDEDLEVMEKTLPDLEDFYEYAHKRNNILANNTVQAMDAEKENIAILVTGGFHTDGITDYFKDKRISYVVIAPKIDELDQDDTRYINALKGKKTPFEEMIENEATPLKDTYFEENENKN